MKVLSETLPTEIYNLGAQSHVKVSFDMPEYTAEVCGVGMPLLMFYPYFPDCLSKWESKVLSIALTDYSLSLLSPPQLFICRFARTLANRFRTSSCGCGCVCVRRVPASAGGGAHGGPDEGGALVPGVELGAVREGARGAADRDDAVLPALAVCGGQALRVPHRAQLPRGVRPVRRQRHPFQPRVATSRCAFLSSPLFFTPSHPHPQNPHPHPQNPQPHHRRCAECRLHPSPLRLSTFRLRLSSQHRHRLQEVDEGGAVFHIIVSTVTAAGPCVHNAHILRVSNVPPNERVPPNESTRQKLGGSIHWGGTFIFLLPAGCFLRVFGNICLPLLKSLGISVCP